MEKYYDLQRVVVVVSVVAGVSVYHYHISSLIQNFVIRGDKAGCFCVSVCVSACLSVCLSVNKILPVAREPVGLDLSSENGNKRACLCKIWCKSLLRQTAMIGTE